MPFFHCHLKRWQIDLSQRSLIQIRADVVPVILLIVSRKMFYSCDHSLALDAFDVAHGHLPREVGIFSHVFKASSSNRCAINIHARRKQNMDSARTRILPQCFSHQSSQLRIPCCCQPYTRRIDRGLRVDSPPHAHWPVGAYDQGKADGRLSPNIEGVEPTDQINLVFQAQFVDCGINTRFNLWAIRHGRLRRQPATCEEAPQQKHETPNHHTGKSLHVFPLYA